VDRPYQDIWVKGSRIQRGIRECAERYIMIRDFCQQYQRPFTVLDIGAAEGYFAVRLAEDFPDCTVVTAEPRPSLGEVLRQNDNPRVLWLRRKLPLADLQCLAEVEHFDVVLALSVIHWMRRPPAESIAALQQLGDHLILELPVEAEATGQEVVRDIELPADGTLLGYGESHLEAAARRPVMVLSQKKTRLTRGYWESDRASTARISSDFTTKVFRKGKKVTYPWLRGINLQTFLKLDGAYPGRKYIARAVQAAYQRLDGPHGDLEPWNVILQGDQAMLIDPKPEADRARHDEDFLARLITAIKEPA